MKRLVWLLLAVFCTALAQVQPVTFATTPKHACCACGGDGSCGMPDCVVPPVSARGVTLANSSPRIAVPAARPGATAVCAVREKFYAAFVEPTAVLAAVRAPARVTPAASVPLFAAHCSFLI